MFVSLFCFWCYTATRFIARLLVVDASLRPTALQILEDPWLVGVGMPHVDLSASAGSLAYLSSPDDGDEPKGMDDSDDL